MERVPVGFYFDYVCPFCYVASHRLRRITREYPVAVCYRFVEIHPDNPVTGRPLSELGYPPAQWARMQAALEQMVAEEGLPLAERSFTTNTRQALLLARRALQQRPGRFLALHDALFHAFFAERRNIGDPAVLTALAAEHGVADLLPEADDPAALAGLLEDVEMAQTVGLTGVPTLQVGERVFPGAVSTETLVAALATYTEEGGD
ncbi:DsbA family oxidoreductase [Arhodomonas sp. SL1]|uniref:DsbA family oxidoreductase n=1 Tax=Arhodomonas sp. SL1 TaxID=3425691 RepID=UPI003F882F9B